MIVYTVIMFASAAAFVVLGRCIAKGNANLINCYHPDRVKDKPLYCRKMGRAMYIMGVTMALSGVLGLFGETQTPLAVGELFLGEACGIVRLFYVQKKYGGGVF